jgi:hypothetical protein
MLRGPVERLYSAVMKVEVGVVVGVAVGVGLALVVGVGVGVLLGAGVLLTPPPPSLPQAASSAMAESATPPSARRWISEPGRAASAGWSFRLVVLPSGSLCMDVRVPRMAGGALCPAKRGSYGMVMVAKW